MTHSKYIHKANLSCANYFIYPGTSGAVVLGILTFSVPDCYSDLPRDAKERFKSYRFEVATKTASIYEKIALESRVLANDIFTRDKSINTTLPMTYSVGPILNNDVFV